MPTLYHSPMSTASRFVRLILSEYGFQTDLVEEQPWERRREFLALNPAGTLPVYLDDNMRSLSGPYVLAEFLDETHGVLKRDRRLLAEDPFQRAEIRRLTEWFLQKMENDVTRPLVRERVYKLQMTAAQGGGPRIPSFCAPRVTMFVSTSNIWNGWRVRGRGSPATD